MANQPLPARLPRSRMTLDLPPLILPTAPLTMPQMSEKSGLTPTIIITPSSPSSELDFQILHVPPPQTKTWSTRLRMPWSGSWTNHGPIALESPPLEDMPITSSRERSHWLFGRLRLRTAMMLAVPIVVVAAHVVIARSYGLSLGLDLGGDEHHSGWVPAHGSEMHSEA
ncbi:hypothetical protein RSOLAG22IIIB_03912 [Rhizoctonia solani]|uniref:Uncharacterized protein n=1 Tax=Rhizoctonia solani TaxID=456999 RepID=A0A0K6FTG3_9AGAM|nr:hypothetical protein RSOLAG22IIIB_03912 [Rhizoctonia solani]